MNTVISTHYEVPLLDCTPASGGDSEDGIRDLLRDTALLVTTLAAGGRTEDVIGLRERCQRLIEQFSTALRRRGYPDDVCQDALTAQCGLLDETALHHLSDKDRSQWDARPLQVERFGLHDAGERVFERLDQRMREASPHVALLECYSAILGLGFLGRYAREGETQRAALIAALSARLQALRPEAEPPLIVDRPATRFADWFYRLSPWATAALACGAAAVVWLVWAAALDMQLAQLAPNLIRP
jgi:type VI secretion system protein ImpK